MTQSEHTDQSTTGSAAHLLWIPFGAAFREPRSCAGAGRRLCRSADERRAGPEWWGAASARASEHRPGRWSDGVLTRLRILADAACAARVLLPRPALWNLAWVGAALLLTPTGLSGPRGGFAQTPAGPPLALVDVTIIDEVGSKPLPHSTILIEGERIAAIFPAGSRPLPVGATSLPLPGRFVIPGLIDSHVHLATDPSGEDSRARTERRLATALLGGVTTVRDMAGDARALASLARDALLGSIPSPDIFYAALFAGPAFFRDPRTQAATQGAVAGEVPWMRAITSATDLRQVVAEARGTGAWGIKLYAALDSTLARQITAEAHRQGLRVWAHASLNPATPIDVVSAGVDVVSHADLLRFAMRPESVRAALEAAQAGRPLDLASPALDTVFAAMVRYGTLFEPTLFASSDDPTHLAFAAAVTRLAHEAGVVLTAGSDSLAGVDDTLPNIHTELELLVDRAGLTPAEALRAATRNAATAIGVLDTRGSVEAGKLADLVVLRADPQQDIRNTRQVELVVKHGKVFRR